MGQFFLSWANLVGVSGKPDAAMLLAFLMAIVTSAQAG